MRIAVARLEGGHIVYGDAQVQRTEIGTYICYGECRGRFARAEGMTPDKAQYAWMCLQARAYVPRETAWDKFTSALGFW